MNELPKKTRELHNHSMNSEMWNDFPFRDDDIIVSTWAKSGTTWVQQIIHQLIFDGKADLPVAEMSPWVDLRIPPPEVKLPMIEAMEHRRVLKTHLPVDALVFSEKAKYVYIARDGRDAVWSFHNHHAKANDLWYEKLNDSPGRVGPALVPPPDASTYFDEWLEGDGYPMWSFWDNIRTWWEIKDLPNVLFLHFNDLKADKEGQIRKIADFLGTPINEDKWDDILLHTSFDYMKENATQSTPLGGIFWDEGAKVFINKGTNGRWKDVLTPEQIQKYEETAVKELGEEAANWLANGNS